MTRLTNILVAVAMLIVSAAALNSCGAAMARNDSRALKAYDKHQIELIARNCGSRGQLMQDPLTGEFSCLWQNKDGSTIMVATQASPYLETVALKQ